MPKKLERTVVQPKGVSKALGAYSHAVRVRAGELVFIAGQVAVNRNGKLVGKGEFPAQMRQVYHNLGQILKSVGARFDHVVQFTTYLVRSQDIEAFYAVRRELYPRLFPRGDYPPNTLLVIDRLVKEDFLLEVEVIAALP